MTWLSIRLSIAAFVLQDHTRYNTYPARHGHKTRSHLGPPGSLGVIARTVLSRRHSMVGILPSVGELAIDPFEAIHPFDSSMYLIGIHMRPSM